MNKALEIKNTDLDDNNLKDLLASIGFDLKSKLEFKLIYSPSFDFDLSSEEIWDIGVKLRTSIKDVTKIDENFSIGDVICFTNSGFNRHQFIELRTAAQRQTASSVEISVSPPSNLSNKQLEEWYLAKERREYEYKLNKQKMKLVPCYFSENAKVVLNFLELKKHTGESLYKMYELMEGHPSNRKVFQNKFNITKDDFMRFGDTVHNPVVSGSLARHAYEDKPKTTNPMTFSEAKSFIEHLARKWLRYTTNENEVK